MIGCVGQQIDEKSLNLKHYPLCMKVLVTTTDRYQEHQPWIEFGTVMSAITVVMCPKEEPVI